MHPRPRYPASRGPALTRSTACALRRTALTAAAAVLVALPAAAQVSPELEARGWRQLTFDGRSPNRFEAAGDDGLRVISQGSVSVAYREISVDLAARPCLSWRWKLTAAPPPTDLSQRGEDDRALAVYVAFPYQPERASFWERIRRSIVEAAAGDDAPGRVVNYVWGGTAAQGSLVDSPYTGRAGVMKILRSGDGPLDQWFEESVDLAGDFEAVFGYAPPAPLSLAVSADSDDTASRAEGLVENLRFEPAEHCRAGGQGQRRTGG